MSFFGRLIPFLFVGSLYAGQIPGPVSSGVSGSDSLFRQGDGMPVEFRQFPEEGLRPDSLIRIPEDSLYTVRTDSLRMTTDSVASPSRKSSLFQHTIEYSARDTLVTTLNKAYLYGEAVLKYDNLELTADYIELDMERKTAYATGLPDSTGKISGLPVFRQDQEEFESRQITYNFNTRRGIIHEVITEQSGGYMHAGIAKRYDNGQIDIKKGKFTTCDDEHPHFYLAMTKAKVIPNNKTITGPAYMVLEDVPLPIGIPFGFIPTIKDNRQSGILIPTWGEEATRGFNLTGGGYYFALSPHFDLRTTFDVYAKGTWGFELASSYLLRYKFRGAFQSRFYRNVSGEPGLNQSKSSSYSLRWNHSVDAKAIPGQSFSVSIDFSTQKFDQLHNYWNTTQLMTNTKRSSIAYSKNWANKPFHLTLNANHSQSSGSDEMTLMLPSLNFKVDRFYPFRSKTSAGKTRWYEDIQLSYTAEMQNTLRAKESKLFSDSALKHMVNGFKQTIPLTLNIKLFKQINITPSLNYTGIIYGSHLEKRYDEQFVNKDGSLGAVITDTLRNLSYAHGFSPNFSMSYSPKLYIMGQARNPLATVQKVRNVITTSFGFSFVPDISSILPEYYRTLEYDKPDREGNLQHYTERYSIYSGYLYGTPTLSGKSGSLTFSLRDNIEAKVRPRENRKDTTVLEESALKKIKILENIGFNTSYNLFADSMKLAPITFSGNNVFFDGKLNLTFSGSFNAYALDENGRSYNRLLIQDGKFLRLTSLSISPSFQLNGTMGKQEEGSPDSSAGDTSGPTLEAYDYFSIPWSLSVSYDFSYSKPGHQSNLIQTLRLNGDLSLTPKWKLSVSTGLDVQTKQVTHTSLNIDRDLHCWVMSLNISPFGQYKYYGFQINVKSAMLSDLRYRKNKSQYDNVSF